MHRVIVIILFLSSINISAQHKLSYIEVDTSSYQQYLRGDWKSLINTGKEALDQGISYYYLQMRIAYAHFVREEYRTAIKYYQDALEFNQKDPVANEYLYYCYLYSGSYNDALIQSKKLTDSQKKAMDITDSVSIVSIGMYYSYASSNASYIHDAIVNDLVDFQNGIQKTTNGFHLPRIGFSHRFGKHVILNHSLSYLSKNEFSLAINSGTYLSPEQIMRQFEYGISMEIAPAKSWIIRPGFNYLNLNIPLYEINNYGSTAGRERLVYDYVNIKNMAFSMLVRKDFRLFNMGLSYVYNNFNQYQTNQAGFHACIYPLANLNLYYSADFYFQHLAYNSTTDNNYMLNQLIGFKIFKNLWIELSGSIPEQINLYDIRKDISYNNIEKIASSLNVSAIVPVYRAHLKLFGSFAYSSNNSYFFPDADYIDPYNKHTYNNFIISGGITWTK